MTPWSVVDSQVEFTAPSWVSVVRQTVKLPDGRIIPDYYKVQLAPFVLVVGESNEGKVVCLEQYRHGPGRVVLTLPGGGMEDQEDSLAAAKRELLEETGFDANNWEQLGSYCTLGNQEGSRCTVFRAHLRQKISEPNSGDLENARELMLSKVEVLDAISSGRFGVASDLAALSLWLIRKN